MAQYAHPTRHNAIHNTQYNEKYTIQNTIQSPWLCSLKHNTLMNRQHYNTAQFSCIAHYPTLAVFPCARCYGATLQGVLNYMQRSAHEVAQQYMSWSDLNRRKSKLIMNIGWRGRWPILHSISVKGKIQMQEYTNGIADTNINVKGGSLYIVLTI